MTLTDYTSTSEGPPEWIDEDQVVSVQGRVGEDVIVELKLTPSDHYDDLRFELIRDGLPVSSDRYRLSMRDNIVQLALKHKHDAGYYSLVATRLGQENGKGASKKIHLSIDETSYEEGDPPVFLRRLSDLAVKVGTRTRFLVEIRSATTLKITWHKNDTPIHEGARFTHVHEGNFYCVDVVPVTVEDQGRWTCMAENRSGRSSCTSVLTVVVPKAYKKPEFIEELRALLTETGTVSLECKVVGVPTPVLKWFKDDKEIKAGDVFALTANPDDPTSLGVYTCEAVNCMGTTYSSSKVHVVGRGSREGSLKPADSLETSGPLPIFKQMLQDECCRIGDTLVLSCRIQVPPWPKAITWYNKGGRVEPSEKYHVMEDGIGGYSIEVKQAEAVDEGEWKCVATSDENMKQFTSCYVAMSIPRNYRKPRFMENLKAVLTEEGLVSFECKVVGFPTPLLTWFKDGQELKPGDVYQLTGTNSLGSYCCIARNCMGEAKSTAELTIEDIQNQLNEEERFQLLSANQPPKFIKGLRSCEARINEDFRFTIQVSVAPEPSLSWYRDDALVNETDKYQLAKESLGTCHLEVKKLEFVDQAEWKCVAGNDFGHSVTSCFLKLIIPKHYKKPKFLESLRAILSEEGAVNLECKVIGVPQPVLKWYKDNVELKPGDIHRIISGQDGTCCLGTYTCEATNCMGTVNSSASLLGFEDKKNAKEIQSPNGHELARNLSLSTIHEERTSQLYDTPQTDHSVTLDERGEVSFSFDGKEVSVSLYETPDLTEEEALQIVEMYADQLSEHVTEHNIIELPPMRFVKESSTSGNLLMEAVVIDVSPDYFVSAEEGDDLRTEADFEDVSIMDDLISSPERDSRGSLKRSARSNTEEDEKAPSRPPRKKSINVSSSKSEKSQRVESDSFHSAQKDEPPLSPLSSLKQDDSDTFADALSSAHLSITESQRHMEHDAAENRKRSLSAERTTGSSLDDGIGGDSSLDSVAGVPRRKKQRRKKQRQDKGSSEEYSDPSDYERRRESESKDTVDTEMKQPQLTELVDKTGTDVGNGAEEKAVKKLSPDEPLDNSRSVKETAFAVPDSAINTDILEETQEPVKDILLDDSRTALREALQTCENMSDTLGSSNIRQHVDDIYRRLEIPRGKGANIETLIDLETPLHALLKAIDQITSAKNVEIIRDILKPSVAQLSRVVENLGLPSLQSTLTILRKVDESLCNIPNGTEGLSSTKSIDESRNISEEIVDPLIDIRSAFTAVLDYIERSKPAANGSTSPQQALGQTSGFAACLAELRECVSHTAHIAMTLKENETLNSLMEFREPLLDLQSILASQERTPEELAMIKETTLAIEKLESVVVAILKKSENSEAISRVGTILKILEDTDKQILKLAEQLSEMENAQRNVSKNLNIDQDLSNVYFALSSVLEKQDKHIASCHLITCIETLRKAIGSSAVTIAKLKNPIDDEIIQEVSKLNESLLNLQRNLLTEKHKPGEEAILNDLVNPVNKLKEIIHNIIESSPSAESIMPMLGLLEGIEKDASLVAKEISKEKSHERSVTKSRKEDTEKTSESKSTLAVIMNRSLDPIKQWLSITSEDSTKDETESVLSSTIEELKRDVAKIAIETSYSEPPSDKSLIEALIELREPLMKLKNAISAFHEPEDLSTLEGLDRPMKCLLQTIMDVLREHAGAESLRSIIDIVELIEKQIPLSIKDTLYRQQLIQSDKTLTVETEEEEPVTASRETIPGTLTEIASTPLEASSIALPTEQAVTEDNSKKAIDDVVLQIAKDEKQEREENACKLIMALSETLEKLQLEMTSILEDFEESMSQTTTIPQSKLANSLEELRRTISTIRVMTTVYGEKIGTFEEKVNQTTLVLTNLLQPLTNVRNLLSRTYEHDVLELMMLNRLTPLLNMMENDVIKQSIGFLGKDGDTEKEFESLICVLEEIKTEIPIVIQEISSRRKILECLWDISKPLESILERMSNLEEAAEETLETDVANILGKPIAIFLSDVKIAAQELKILDRRGPVILELQNLFEPLLEFHSCLSMVQSSRRSLVPEASLLDERRSVILRAVDGLQRQVCQTIETIADKEEASLFNESLTQLNSAILQVQKQIGKTDYSRRSSSTKIPLQHRLTGTLNHLASTVTALAEQADKDTYEIISKSLEALQKQISLAQTQFIQTGSQLIDEEAIVEGFLYPTNQLLSALNVLKENTQQKAASAISYNLLDQLRELAGSITELSSSLSAHRTELVREGASDGAPIVETFSAVIDVLDHAKDSIMAIEKIVGVEQKASVIITKVESVTDEIIEVSQKEIESIMTVTEISPVKTVAEENAQLKIEDVPTQTSDLKDLETSNLIEQAGDNLVDRKECEEKQKEEEIQNRTQMLKFNSAVRKLEQPLRELISFVKSATQKSLISKSEEDKRKIRELTALIQILYDLQATNTAIKTVLPSSSVVPLDSQFRRLENILADLERTTDTIISLTHGEVRPELKKNIVASLQSLSEPLDALEKVLAPICQTIGEDKYIGKNEEPLAAIAKILIPCIIDTVKSLNAIEISRYVRIAGEEELEIQAVKEEGKDIEETTARPLEELIEAIMDSQEQVKCDKTSPFESSSLTMDPTESKGIDDMIPLKTEKELNKALVEEIDGSVTQVVTSADAMEIPQQALTSSLVSSHVAESPIEEKVVTPISLAKSLEQVEQSLATIDQQKMELSQSYEDTMQREQVKAETLQAIISPLQVLCKSFGEIGKMETLETSDEKTALIEPLLNLELTLSKEMQQIVSLPFENTDEMKQDTMTLQKVSVASVLEELQKSIAAVQEQVQLNTVIEAGSSETPKMRLMQAVEKPLEDLKMSIACIRTDPMISEHKVELSSAEHVTVLQTVAKSVEEFGERCMSIIGQLKMEAESAPPLEVAKQEEQKLNLEVLHKIIDPIHVLHETLSQIEDHKDHKTELLEIAEQKRENVELSAVMRPLEKLEQSLMIGMQQMTVVQEDVTKEMSENQVTLANADLKPVLEELKNAIVVVQQQAACSEDIPAVQTLNEALEGLKMPLANVEEIVDRLDETTETEKISTLLTFAKSMEETANQLVAVANQQVAQHEIRETSLLKMVTVPIEGLQSAILKLEDRVSQTLETKESVKAVALECMLQPLQQLQQSFLTAVHQETALSLQRLPIKPVLENLSKFVAVVQDQVISIQDKLPAKADTNDLTALKDLARSLGDLRTSTVVLQQLSAIENAGQQIVEIENASALQAFTKSIEEFRKCCSVVIERPRVIEAFTTNVECEQSSKVDTQLLENIIAPLRILQEQILTIEEIKMQQSENLDIAEEKKPVTVLSSLVGPLQQLEKSFVATVQKEHVIEHEEHNPIPESSSVSLEKLALQPILEEVQKSIATVQEHVILEAGSKVTSEVETSALLKSIAQPLVDLRASIASVQQVTAVAPDSLNELAQQQNISALETFAETLHNLAERIAMCNHQQIIMEPAADTISEDVSSLNTWADVIEEPFSKVTRPMVIDQGTVESPVEVAVSISEDEASALKTLAKPLTELRERLALIVEERRIIAPSETACSLSDNENISFLKTMLQPLLELKDAAAIVIQEQTAIERASEHSFAIERDNESTLRPLIEPLEELRHSIAVIQDQMLMETPVDRPKDDTILDTLAEPLLDLQRAISVLETRVMSPDVESMPGDTGNSWITECLAVPLYEIERSIADIRQCTVMEPETIVAEKQAETITPDWTIVDQLMRPMEGIKTTVLRIENDSAETEALKTIIRPLTIVQENLTLLRDKANSSTIDEESTTHTVAESLSNLEKCISFVEEKIVDKPLYERSSTTEMDTAAFAILSSPLTELKRSIVTAEESPSVYLKNLERPLELVQEALETVLFVQQRKKLSNLSTKLLNTILDINDSIESIERKVEEQQAPVVVEIHIECRALGMLTNPLQNIKQCIKQIQEEPSTANLMISGLEKLEKSIAVIREQSADKPLAESQHTNFGAMTGLSKNLIPCLHEMQESIDTTKALWREGTVLEGLTVLEEPFCKLQAMIKMMSDQFSIEETICAIDEQKMIPQKKPIKRKVKKSEIEATVEKEDKTNEIMKVETEETKLAKDKDSTNVNDTKDEASKERSEKRKDQEAKKKEEEDKKSEVKKSEQSKTDKAETEQEKEGELKEREKHKKYKEEVDKIKKEEEEQEKNKETGKVRKETEQREKSIKDKEVKKDNAEYKEIEQIKSLKDQKEAEGIKRIEKQVEETDTTENIRNKKEFKEIVEAEKIKKDQDEQKNIKDYKEIKKLEEEQKDTKEDDRVKRPDQHKENEIERQKKEEKKREREEQTDGIKQIEQGNLTIEEAGTVQKEKDNSEAKAGEIEKKEKYKIPKENEKLDKEQMDSKNKDNNILLKQNEDVRRNEEEINQLKKEEEQEQQKELKEIKEEERVQKKEEIIDKLIEKDDEKTKHEKDIGKIEKDDEKPKHEKAEDQKKKKEEFSKKEEAAQVKAKEEEQKKKAKLEKPKEEKAREKIKEKDSEKIKGEKTRDMEKEKEVTNKKEESVQVEMKGEERKEKDKFNQLKEEEAIAKEKGTEDEKVKDEKTKDVRDVEKKESNRKEEAAQVKIKEERKKINEIEKPKEEEAITKEKGEGGEKAKDEEAKDLEKIKEESSKKEEITEVKIKEEEQKKKDEVEKPKKEKAVGKEKEKKGEKTKDEEAKDLEKIKEESSKKEKTTEMKIKEEEQKKKDETEKPKEEKPTAKIKGEDKKGKDKIPEKLEKEKEESSRKEETAQIKIKKEEHKEEVEIERSKREDEEQKQPTKTEELKIVADEQIKAKENIRENEVESMQRRSKRENKKTEKVVEEQIDKEKEGINKIEQEMQHKQNEYVNSAKKENKEGKRGQQYKEANENREQNGNESFKEIEKIKREEERRQWKSQDDKNWLLIKEKERFNKSSESKVQKEENDREQGDNDKRLHRIEIEDLEIKRALDGSEKRMANYVIGSDEEMFQKRSDEKRIRRDETARLLREEEQRLRKKREEEIFRNKQRREEQIRENEWSRKRENESDRFLRNMLETRYKSDRPTSMFFNDVDYSRDKREYTSRFDSGISAMLASTSRSCSWRDSLTSLSRKRINDYWDYKLRDFSTDKYYADAGSSYRRRRRRESRMIYSRSISSLKYEDYSTGDSDTTLVPSTRIRPIRRTRTDAVPHISFDSYESSPSSYTGFDQSESLPIWDKPKKPSFCTRLTNRVVGVGMRIRLTCTVLGNPEPRVRWTKDDQMLDVSTGRCKTRLENGMAYLELHDALSEDAGIYTCWAENAHGTSTTESTLKVYSDYKPSYSPPTFVRSIKDTYRYSDHKLILECRVRAHPAPTVSWLKDGEILQSERYKQTYLDDDVYRLEIVDPNFSDNGQYTCRAVNDLRTEEISHMVHIDDREWRSTNQSDRSLDDESGLQVTRRPRFSNLLKDYNVPAGGTIALQVEVKGLPAPEVKWLRGDRKEPIAIPKARTFVERGLHTLIVPEATESERGTYVCRAINAYGQVDISATVDVISSSAIDGGKPAVFVSRPAKKSIDVTIGEDVSTSFRVSGTPKPRVTWMKGLTDITDGPRSYKESIDDYVRLTLKRAIPSDEGTYCILVKNRYGCDRCFFSIKVKQRARSLTPSPDWDFLAEREVGEEHDDDMSYVRNVPGPISSEPVVVDGGKNWLSLSWGKAERRGPAPVIAYKVDAWLLGGDGGARWVELGITPINAFDAFNLRPGGEYKFRVTPRNRYGWGEPVTMVRSVLVNESTDLPEFTKILSGQLKALEGSPVKLECEIRGDPKTEIRWYRETAEIDPRNDPRFAICHSGIKCSLTIENVREEDSGRYVCEASNRIGKVSSFARVLVVNDPRIIEADEKLRTSLSIEPEDRPPQFTMRIRDRRVQTTYPVRLTCQVTGHPVPEITWYKNGTEIAQDDRRVFWDDDSNFHTLEIIQSTLEDSGCYMVTARNINGSVSCRCTLVVDKGIRAYIAPEFLRDLDAAYTIRLGDELRMSAQLEAYPSVGVVWHRDGIRLRPSRRAVMTLSHDGTVQFSLANVTARDAGVYNCTATNVVGQTETSTRVAVVAEQDQPSIDGLSGVTSASPDIPYSKEPLFVTKPLSSEAIEGDPVIILCEVVGDPKPEVIWLRDFLKPDYYKDAPHFRLVGAGPQYRLEIPYAKLDFTGTYSVIARNCHGEAKAVISLQIYAKGQGKEDQTKKSPHGKVLTLPIITRELRDLRCCDGDAVSLECKVHATPEPPLVRWERGGKIIAMVGDFTSEFEGETARLNIQHVYPEDEGEYTCVAYNDLGKAYTSACLVVDVPEGKESTLSQRLTRPVGLLSAGSTPRSTPRSTPIRSLSPAVSHGREFRSPQVLPRRDTSKRPKVCPPKFYAVPHNRLVQEGETVRFQCAVVGHPSPWIRWDKDGNIVTPSARISIKERDDVKILEIVDVMREDAALYRVTAENDFGRIEASARLEVISRYEPTSRTIRTRSASPRTYPSFDRSLLSTTSRINGRLQLECRIRGTPSVTPTWYRNGRPLERSTRVKRYFDGTTAKIEISKVKASDAGEYTCVATNILGSTRNSCQVIVLDPRDSSIADRNAPQFLQLLPEESIVMENHCYEFQTGVTGTPPFAVTWSKDGRELPDNDCHNYVIYGDGGVALRLSEVRPQNAGEYTCAVRNNFGVASCSGLFAVQGYKDVSTMAPQFTKTPLSIIAAKGATACFCARTQCGKSMEVTWTINGKDARENPKCKIERDGNVNILKIRDVSSRDTGEIRCTASVNGKGPSVSCVAKLRLQRSRYDLGDCVTKSKNIQSPAEVKTPPISTGFTGVTEKDAESSSLKCRRQCKESATRVRSSSFPRRTATCTNSKHASPLPTRKRASNNKASTDIRKSRFENDPSAQKITKEVSDNNAMTTQLSSDHALSYSSNERDAICTLTRLSSLTKTVQPHQRFNDVTENRANNWRPNSQSEPSKDSSKFNDKSIIKCPTNDEQEAADYRGNPNKEDAGARVEEPTRATIVKEPTDVIVFKGKKAILTVVYQGRPEPTVKWLRVNREVRPDEKIGITGGDGVSCLTLDDVTYDHAGKYEVSVENSLGKERRFFSLAVEGPPEPPADKPSVNVSADQATIVWRSPTYDGGRTVIGYTVEAKRAGESTWTAIAESCHSLSQTLPTAETNFVVPGESYRFRVRAENIHGLSDPGVESDHIRIPRQGETMFQGEEEDEFEPSFEARIVEPEEGRLFGERYDVLEELGKGRYGVVRKVIERVTGMCFAAKFVRTIKAKGREQVREEIKIMNILRHPKLLLLAAAYESPRETVMVTEYISGGELFERVVADDFTLTERDSILFMRQICEGVEYMHKNKIVHLDLKPENIMCRTRTSHQIKLIDFGLAQTLKPDTPIRVLFGTPEFIPPEIISYEPIGTESDMWSIGVICYVLLTGLSPFMGDNDAETFANITRADYDLEDEAFDAISSNAKDFISGLLIKRKELRMSTTQCLEHPWMAQCAAAMSIVVLPTEKLKKFIIRRKWQKTGNAIRALGRMAILSAYSRRSPTKIAESSPTLEQQFDNIESSSETEPRKKLHPLCAPEENMETQMTIINNIECKVMPEEETTVTDDFAHELKNIVSDEERERESSVKEENNLNSLSKQINIERETAELESILETKNTPQDFTTHLEIVISEEKKKGDRKLVEKSIEMEQRTSSTRSQTLHRVFRGDSRDSGIGDCNTSQMTSPLQVDELGIVSTIVEEVDSEAHRADKQTSREEETLKNRSSSTEGILTSVARGKETSHYDTESTKRDGKVATKSGVTKASCDINPERRVADEGPDARLLAGRRFLPTGNVSRTARIFERESETSRSDDSQVSATQRAYPAPIVAGKPYNERIQKAFAFWNK